MPLITVNGARATLDGQGNLCPACSSTDVGVTAEPGDEYEPSKEHFVCRGCTTEWTVALYAAKINSIMLPDGIRHYGFNETSEIEKGVFDQIPCPRGPVADALNEFLRQMKLSSVQGKGEALAKLAFLARVDLNSLVGNQPSEPPTLPSDTE